MKEATEPMSAPGRCPRCLISFEDHLGVIGLCGELQRVQAELAAAKAALDKLRTRLTNTWSVPSGTCLFCTVCGRWGTSQGDEPDHTPDCPLATAATIGRKGKADAS